MQRYLYLVGALYYVIVGSDIAVFPYDDTGARALYQLHLAPHVLRRAGHDDLDYRVLILVYYLSYGQLASRGIAEIQLRELGVVSRLPAVDRSDLAECAAYDTAKHGTDYHGSYHAGNESAFGYVLLFFRLAVSRPCRYRVSRLPVRCIRLYHRAYLRCRLSRLRSFDLHGLAGLRFIPEVVKTDYILFKFIHSDYPFFYV